MTNSNNATFPDGKYVVEILDMDSTRNPKGVPVVEWHLMVRKGAHSATKFVKKYHLTNEHVEDFLKRELALFGLNVANGKEFLEKKDQCVGMLFELEAVTNQDGWQSFYVKRVLKAGSEDNGDDGSDLGW